jgi:heme/copper-type cytochrome/quinol oxidase subunit 3
MLGMLLFVGAELMFFAGMISAFTIARSAAGANWPPEGQPRLPAGETAINTAALLLSAGTLYLAAQRFKRDRSSAMLPLVASFGLGAFFVLFQGFEWVALLSQGLTLTSSQLGSFFYLIIGTHTLHAIVALLLLGTALARLRARRLARSTFNAAQVFWYFVVGVWPVLYGLVYL